MSQNSTQPARRRRKSSQFGRGKEGHTQRGTGDVLLLSFINSDGILIEQTQAFAKIKEDLGLGRIQTAQSYSQCKGFNWHQTHDGVNLVKEVIDQSTPQQCAELIASGLPIQIVLADGHGALHWAIEVHAREKLKILLENGVQMDSEAYSCSPIEYAIEHGHAEGVELLLAYGANPMARTKNGLSLVDWAEENGLFEIADMIGAEAAYLTETKNEPLLSALPYRNSGSDRQPREDQRTGKRHPELFQLNEPDSKNQVSEKKTPIVTIKKRFKLEK